MCDNLVVLSDISKSKRVIMAKNSDRPTFDCQPLIYYAGKTCNQKEMIELAYVTISQVSKTYTTIGGSPYWCWGYEEGINEFGVAIGNEAIFTKDLKGLIDDQNKAKNIEKGILGMELVRLGLERGKTAREALEVMTSLIEKYGQWGSAVPTFDHTQNPYNNSYIISDAKEAWILETVGKHWVTKKIKEGSWAISNEPSIRNDWDEVSENIVKEAFVQGWCKEEVKNTFDFAFSYTDFEKPLQVSHIRAQRVRQLIKQGVLEEGSISLKWIKKILRDHYEDTFLEGPYFNAALPDFHSICMHSSPSDFTWGNTASSSIFILPKDENQLPMVWWTPLTPCTGLYIPIFIHGGMLPKILSTAGTFVKSQLAPPEVEKDAFSENSYWWIFRELLDLLKGDEYGSKFIARQKILRTIFDELEEKWEIEVSKIEEKAVYLRAQGEKEKASMLLSDFTNYCIEEAMEAVQKVKKIIATI